MHATSVFTLRSFTVLADGNVRDEIVLYSSASMKPFASVVYMIGRMTGEGGQQP